MFLHIPLITDNNWYQNILDWVCTNPHCVVPQFSISHNYLWTCVATFAVCSLKKAVMLLNLYNAFQLALDLLLLRFCDELVLVVHSSERYHLAVHYQSKIEIISISDIQ